MKFRPTARLDESQIRDRRYLAFRQYQKHASVQGMAMSGTNPFDYVMSPGTDVIHWGGKLGNILDPLGTTRKKRRTVRPPN